MKLSYLRRERNAEIRVNSYGVALGTVVSVRSSGDLVREYAAQVRFWHAVERVWADYAMGARRKVVRS